MKLWVLLLLFLLLFSCTWQDHRNYEAIKILFIPVSGGGASLSYKEEMESTLCFTPESSICTKKKQMHFQDSVCTGVSVHVWLQECVHTAARGQPQQPPTSSFLRQGLSLAWSSPTRLGLLVTKSQRFESLCFPSTGITGLCFQGQHFFLM